MNHDTTETEVLPDSFVLPDLKRFEFQPIHYHDWTFREALWFDPLADDIRRLSQWMNETTMMSPRRVCPDPDCTYCQARWGAYNQAVWNRYRAYRYAQSKVLTALNDELNELQRISRIRHNQQLVGTIKILTVTAITITTGGWGGAVAGFVVSTGGDAWDAWQDAQVGDSPGLSNEASAYLNGNLYLTQAAIEEAKLDDFVMQVGTHEFGVDTVAGKTVDAVGIVIDVANQAYRWHSFDEMMNSRIRALESNIAGFKSLIVSTISAASTPYKSCAMYDNCQTYFEWDCHCDENSSPYLWKAKKNNRGDSNSTPIIPRSCDPNEMRGPLGVGDPDTERFVKPEQQMDYTVYFENKETADTSAQEIWVTAQLDPSLDWSTFEWSAVSFGNQVDNGLAEKAKKRSLSSEVKQDGTDYYVVTDATFDETTGTATWYLHIADKTTADKWPKNLHAGILPPNNPKTHIGEGYVSYRVNVRKDAVPGTQIDASAEIKFDTNPVIPTDPAWFNIVATIYEPVVDLGDGTTATINLVVGQPYGVLPTPAARAGYTFGGWFTGPNGTGTRITPESIVEAGASGIYPHWIKNPDPPPPPPPPPTTYSVVFNPNGGSGAMAAQTIVPGASVALSANTFSKQDNVFLGWATSANGEVVYADKAFVKDLAAVGQSVTFYAQWAVLKYTVKFSGNGGKLPKKKKMKALAMTYGTSKKMSKNLFTRKGYVFIGWSTKKKGPVEYANKASVRNLTTKGGAVTLYAQWAKPTYKVAFFANGGKGTMAAQTIKYGKATKLSKNKFKAPKGRKFAGWATSKANAKKGTVAYKDGKPVKNLVTTGKTVKLYAVWKRK